MRGFATSDFKWPALLGTGLATLVSLTACVSPVAMHRAVIEYDRTVSRVEAEMLLLNIARARHHHPLHFTAVTNVAATFDFRTNAGFSGGLFQGLSEGVPFDVAKRFYRLDFGATVAENPTITITPIQGEEFAKRILAPMEEKKLEFLLHRGVDPSTILRLIAQGIVIDERPGSDFPFLALNSPSRPEEYEEFRRIAIHLSYLNRINNLYVQPVLFEEIWPLPVDHPLTAQALDKGYQWTHPSPGQSPRLVKRVTGRVAITNYNPILLSNEERRRLHEDAERFPRDRVLIDISPGFPGGDFAFHGRVLLRSLEAVLAFLARGIAEEPEFHVEPDPRSGPVPHNPSRTIEVLETLAAPADAAFSVLYADKWYSIRNIHEVPLPGPALGDGKTNEKPPSGTSSHAFSLEAFRALNQVFQLTVSDVAKVPSLPITIAK